MKKSLLLLPPFVTLICCLTACSTKQQTVINSIESDTWNSPRRIGNNSTTYYMPKAIIYKTTKDYSRNVPITMDDSRTQITSYPAPSDLLSGTPLSLCDGWLLDCRGIGRNTVFLDYTYEEYATLNAAPSFNELKKHIIDKHPIAEMFVIPLTIEQAKTDTARCNAIISGGFKDCTPIVRSMTKPQ